MRLLRARIDQVGGSSGLLNGLDIEVRRRSEADPSIFQPLCLIGPNLSAAQEVLITTHAPFVPSDTPRSRILIFRRAKSDEEKSSSAVIVTRPDIQTFGAKYDEILEACFQVYPPISAQPREVIGELMQSQDPEAVEEGLKQLGPSIQKIKLIDHLNDIKATERQRPCSSNCQSLPLQKSGCAMH